MTDRHAVLVTGGRNFTDQRIADIALDALHKEKTITLMIHGDARGADSLAKKWAFNNNIPQDIYTPNWDDLVTPPVRIKYNSRGKRYNFLAGFNRNSDMLKEAKPDLVVAFPGGNGTQDMVKKAVLAGVPVEEVSIER